MNRPLNLFGTSTVGRCLPVQGAVVRGVPVWILLLVLTSAWSAEPASQSVDDQKASETEAAIPSALSVAPLDHVEYPEDRPAWVSDRPSFGDGDHRLVIVSSPCDTVEESIQELDWMRRAAVTTYVCRLVGADDAINFYTFSDDDLDRQLIARRYSGEVTQGGDTKYESAIEIQFDEDKKDQIRAAWRNVEVGDRLKAIGGLASLGFAVLVCMSGLTGILSRRFPTPGELRP